MVTGVGVIPGGTAQANMPANNTIKEMITFRSIWLLLNQMIPLTKILNVNYSGFTSMENM
jgi:hypothetical protein